MIEANDDELQVIAMVFGIFCCLISWALCVWTTNYGEIIVKTNERKRWHWTHNFDEIQITKHKWDYTWD